MGTPMQDLPEWDLQDRLHKSLRHAHLSGSAMARELGVHRNTVNNYLSGKTLPDRRTLIVWALRTGVDLAWLETGLTPRPRGPRGQKNETRLGTEPIGSQLALVTAHSLALAS